MAAEAPVSMSAGSRRICSVCCQAVAAYTCPRCHKAYCTSACYKQHGHQCTEAFYREQATSQMKATRADAQQTQQMMRILQRMHEQGGLEQQQQQQPHGGSSEGSSEDGSEIEGGELAAAAGVAAAATGLDKLLAQSPEFQQLLQRAAAEGDAFEVHPSDLSAELADRLGALALSGRLSHLLQPWRPWWGHPAAAELRLNSTGQRVVAELAGERLEPIPNGRGQRAGPAAAAAAGSANGSSRAAGVLQDGEGFAPLPEPPEQPLPALAQLAGPSFRPSPLLPFELLQLLVAYCAVMHCWNGEPDCGESSGESCEHAWEAAEQLLLLAPPLQQQAARVAGGSSRRQQAQQSAKQQDADEPAAQQQAVPVVADSIRCACVQLADAAAALHGELRALLQQATADALALLQLGRAAVLLALTDSHRLLEQGRRNLKQQRQQHKQQQQQPPAQLPGKGGGARSTSSLQQSSGKQQQQVLLEQQLKLACRKVVFLQVWCNEQGPTLYEQLALQLAMELREQQAINTPAAAGVMLGVQPVQSVEVVKQQQQQQQLGAHVLQQASTVKLQPRATTSAALQAANGQHQQQHVEQTIAQSLDTCSQAALGQQQQQQLDCLSVLPGSSAPLSDLYDLD